MSNGKKRSGASVPPVWESDATKKKTVIRPRKGLLERNPKTVGRVAALEELQKELAAATEVYLHQGDGGRQGVYDATCALIAFLTSQGIPFAALEPVIAVQTAIVDADRGTASPVFAPIRTPTSGKPPISDMQRAFDGKIATVMECCVHYCRAAGKWPFVRPAAQLAARLINNSDWPAKYSARELEELRERVWQSRNSMERSQVEIYLKSGVAKQYPLEFAKILLRSDWVNPPAKVSE